MQKIAATKLAIRNANSGSKMSNKYDNETFWHQNKALKQQLLYLGGSSLPKIKNVVVDKFDMANNAKAMHQL